MCPFFQGGVPGEIWTTLYKIVEYNIFYYKLPQVLYYDLGKKIGDLLSGGKVINKFYAGVIPFSRNTHKRTTCNILQVLRNFRGKKGRDYGVH